QADFLPDFANGGGVVIFAGVHMAGGGGIPHARLAVFFYRALFQEDFAAAVEHEPVHGAMQQAEGMHFAARLAIDYFVALIDDVENVFGHKNFRRARSDGLTPAVAALNNAASRSPAQGLRREPPRRAGR